MVRFPNQKGLVVLAREDIERFFFDADVVISGNGRLRTPQIQGHEAAREYFAGAGHRAVEQIPVGCGKTGLISILPFRVARGRVLVIAPNLTIKTPDRRRARHHSPRLLLSAHRRPAEL